ncbi:ComEA family DNA-binding protein [Aliiglaciecola litoralis]|uniref:Helix-hairpin-helix DNA-binding motif class 1 domain-containing protein n=1 Tax=Aliiglaciecola litoralis TaxID=582857 RepID=A0ABN1LJS6_9ALTE
MKKFLPTIVIGCAVFLASAPSIQAKSLEQKIATAKTQLQTQSQKVNVNTASIEQLQRLPGIGAKKAAEIVAFRNANGEFSTLQDLKKVKGIGLRMIEKLQDEAVVNE